MVSAAVGSGVLPESGKGEYRAKRGWGSSGGGHRRVFGAVRVVCGAEALARWGPRGDWVPTKRALWASQRQSVRGGCRGGGWGGRAAWSRDCAWVGRLPSVAFWGWGVGTGRRGRGSCGCEWPRVPAEPPLRCARVVPQARQLLLSCEVFWRVGRGGACGAEGEGKGGGGVAGFAAQLGSWLGVRRLFARDGGGEAGRAGREQAAGVHAFAVTLRQLKQTNAKRIPGSAPVPRPTPRRRRPYSSWLFLGSLLPCPFSGNPPPTPAGGSPSSQHLANARANLASVGPLSPQLACVISRVLQLSPDWEMDDTGRVDNPPVVADPSDAALDLSQVRCKPVGRCEGSAMQACWGTRGELGAPSPTHFPRGCPVSLLWIDDRLPAAPAAVSSPFRISA